jgi:hypothetical protein
LPDPDEPAPPLEPGEAEPEIEALPASAPTRGRTAQRIDGNLAKPLAMTGALLPFGLGAAGVLESWPLLGAAAVATCLGYLIGTGLHTDTCSACRGRLPRALPRCPHCEASIVEASAELEEDDEVAAAEDAPEDDDADPNLSLMLATYAAWAIQREHISESAEETHAELIVAVRCGERPTERLAQAWDALASELKEPAASFVLDYFGRRHGPASQDYTRLLHSAALRDTPQGYARVADLLDTRLAEWTKSHTDAS